MKRLAAVIASAALAVVVAAAPAQADIIVFDNGNDGYYLLDDPLNGSAGELAFVEAETGADVDFLNKYEYCDPDDGCTDGEFTGGAVDGSHFNAGGGLQENTKTIGWDLTGTGYGVSYVLIKDGAVDNQTLYRLYYVTEAQFLVGGGEVGFPPTYEKDISHVSFFGPGASVPDGGMTVILLGSALVALGALRRRL